MKLRYDPFQIFKSAKTPASIYARQKWLGQHNKDQWQTDFNSATARLRDGQAADGSWNQSIPQTIDHLFGLHLTIRESNTEIDKALDWLLAQTVQGRISDRLQKKETRTEPVLTHQPFVTGRRDGLLLGACLFLSSIFGRSQDPQILSLYRMLNKDAAEDRVFWKDMTCFNNILRAFVVHPKYANKRAAQLAVDRLAALKTPKGDWGNQVPFYLNLNALAHLSLPGVDNQLEGAFRHLVETQKPDGTWGTDQPEWNAFLVVHAFKNKNKL